MYCCLAERELPLLPPPDLSLVVKDAVTAKRLLATSDVDRGQKMMGKLRDQFSIRSALFL